MKIPDYSKKRIDKLKEIYNDYVREEDKELIRLTKEVDRLNNIIKEIEKMFNHETLIKYYYGMSYEFEINDFKDDIFKIIKGSDKK